MIAPPPSSSSIAMTLDLMHQHALGEASVRYKRKLSLGGGLDAGAPGGAAGAAASTSAWPHSQATQQHTTAPPQPHPPPPHQQAPPANEAPAGAAGSSASTDSAHNSTSQSKASKSAQAVKLADWFAKMVCYIWFAPNRPNLASRPSTPGHSPLASYAPLHAGASASGSGAHATSPLAGHAQDPFAASLAELRARGAAGSDPIAPPRSPMIRLKPQANFITFVRDVLNTTQLSLSVVLCALLYIYRFKSLHPTVNGREGSEYRMTVAGLMLANKFLDDNTYTSATWSQISHIKLKDVTRMEIEFWSGLGMSIHVTEHEFTAWKKRLEVMTDQRAQSLARREREALAAKSRQQAGVSAASAWIGLARSPSLQSYASFNDDSALANHRASSPLRSMLPPPPSAVSAPGPLSAQSSPMRALCKAAADAQTAHTAGSLPPLPSAGSPTSALGWPVAGELGNSTAASSSAAGSSGRYWSDALSPGASSHTSAQPNGALRISISPPSAPIGSAPRASSAAASFSQPGWAAALANKPRRGSASSWCEGSTSYPYQPHASHQMPPPGLWPGSAPGSSHGATGAKRTFGSIESDSGPAFSPTWDAAQVNAKRFAASSDGSNVPAYPHAPSLGLTQHSAQQQAAQRAMRPAPAHGYNLRSMRRSSAVRQMSPLGNGAGSSHAALQHRAGSAMPYTPQAYTRSVAPNSVSASRESSAGLTETSSAAASASAAAAMEHYRSLFAMHDSQTPYVLVAPFQANQARGPGPRALTYYQLASGVPQGIPSYHFPAGASTSASGSRAQTPTAASTPERWAVQQQQQQQMLARQAQAHAQAQFQAHAQAQTQQQHQDAAAYSLQPRMLDISSCAPTSWSAPGASAAAWHREPFNNAQDHLDGQPLALPAAFIRRSPSQIL